jgi:hypothetical protein
LLRLRSQPVTASATASKTKGCEDFTGKVTATEGALLRTTEWI